MIFRRGCALILLLALLASCVPGTAESGKISGKATVKTSGIISGKASTLREFAVQVEAHASKLETTWSVECEKPLMEELKKESPEGEELTLLSEILMQYGCLGSFSAAWYNDRIELMDLDYYPGWRIAHFYETGDTAKLTQRERKTLLAALSLVTTLSGTDLEKERAIYDALCAGITYETAEDAEGEKDCAIGALLNGRADCDGYSDAMLLCCALAGIPCRTVRGKAILTGRQTRAAADGSHMWNLVYIGSSWVMCDVTWGDQENEDLCYLYFNIGSLDASRSYQWNEEILFTEIAPAADFATQLMPDQQPASVSTQEEVYCAVRAATAAGRRRIMLFCPGEILWQSDRETFRRMIRHGAAGSSSYGDNGRFYELSSIALPEMPFCFCDSREEILSAISAYADAEVQSFSLYFHPDLSPLLFADGHAALHQILAESRLAESGRYMYSEESGCITLTDASYLAEIPSCASEEEVMELIRRELPARPSSLTFALTGGLTLEELQEAISETVFSLGVYSYRTLWNGSRVQLIDLEYFR